MLDAPKALKLAAHVAVNAAIRSRQLRSPEDCESCGGPWPLAHHYDYNKPLSVIWLCAYCHYQLHAHVIQQKRLAGVLPPPPPMKPRNWPPKTPKPPTPPKPPKMSKPPKPPRALKLPRVRIRKPYVYKPHPAEALLAGGAKTAQVILEFGITRQRVHQIRQRMTLRSKGLL